MNTKLSCLLLDDELPGLAYLRVLCEQIPGLEVVRAFNDPLKLVQDSKDLSFDFCILDIEMPQLSGLEVAAALQGKPVIFTTAYKEYAAEAFDLNAVDYVRKPIEKARLEQAVKKVAERITKSREGFMQVNTNKGKSLLYFDQLSYITTSETDKRDKKVVLDNGEEIIVKNLSFDELLALLPEQVFCRTGKKEIIALKAVKHYTHSQVTLQLKAGELRVPLGDNFKKEFLAKMEQ